MQQLSARSLFTWLHSDREAPILLDVREPWEFAICHLPGAQLMPMSTVVAQSATLDKASEIVLICHHGMRSAQTAVLLAQQGFSHLYNLQGGIAQWAAEIDPAMPVY